MAARVAPAALPDSDPLLRPASRNGERILRPASRNNVNRNATLPDGEQIQRPASRNLNRNPTVAESDPVQRPASRNLNRNPPLRPTLKRRSPLAAAAAPQRPYKTRSNSQAGSPPPLQHHYRTRSQAPAEDDSSDDEGAAPALSAAAEELLRTQDRPDYAGRGLSNANNYAAPSLGSPVGRVQHSGSPVSRVKAQTVNTNGSPRPALASPSPRVVRISRNSPAVAGSLRRTNSTSSVADGSPRVAERHTDLKTPATTRPRSALASSLNASGRPASVSSAYASATKPALAVSAHFSASRYASANQAPAAAAVGSESKLDSAEDKNDAPAESLRRGLRSQAEERGLHNSIRIKRTERVGVTGTFLRGPARRGMIRRQSEEESPSKGNPAAESIMDKDNGERARATSPLHRESPRSANRVRFANSAEVATILKDSKTPIVGVPPIDSNPPSHEGVHIQVLQQDDQQPAAKATDGNKAQAPVFKVPPPLPSHFDQENEPPPTFKRNKPGLDVLGNLDVLGADKMRAPTTEKPQVSPARKALAPRSQNTPMRPAPPPPKMSVLETAAAQGGAASVTQNKKKKNYISVNGKLFSRMECIGRGGSGRVYRVMAENFKLYALKRVSLEDVDELAIRGFKGEIDLLRRLDKVERVVRLHDFEINDERKTLSVLMDLAELDLKKILDPRLDADTGRLDLTFTRHTWKEMLECVAAIHAHDVVHSDLKPANFVLMQGRLKLIDFGIANAIQDDTVNVHREHQIGTPNYMAPEALLDTNALPGGRAGTSKLMKLGKPSDVWSLGCILYQMVYGRPPFGHIPNSMNKVMAITDRTHAISFPELGCGRVPVPTGLIRTLRRCLHRDPAARPTIPQLLDPRDPFLYPDAPGTVPVTPEIVRKLQENVLKIIEAKGLPAAALPGKPRDEAVREWLDMWSPQLFASIKASLEKGAA